ncbi:acyl-CoA dehydrogenase family protein [Petropleomorpha daqingensis]|uniref:Alkylation response protein AidB-like acyl-CoA dehydrogenase n=1 Tax=Petropleomorpha daqingensis TaxID=2026353 RepID=A0A853CN95_9ACTN|nr:acyl-CoA dehydrogenase family protein [Petropleomorpha daqingensis]NYJ08916.1 alkylation response protein AidB-like acyl-CoA dehydrogenase [Petropleomorpha daqingensis]
MAVSFSLSPQQEQLKQVARQFAEAHLRDLAEAVRHEADPARRADLARPAFEKAVEAGFLKGLIPVPFGGAAGSGVDAAILIEEWASYSPDFVISMAGPLIALVPVYQVGTPEQIRQFVAPFLADGGAPVAAMAYSEPGGSANFAAPPPAEGVRTTAVPDGDEYVINGRKAWASHLPGWDGDGPDVMTIVCRAPGGVSLVVAEREHLAGHIEIEHLYDLPALRGCLTARIGLVDVRVPKANLLGREGQGVELTRNAFVGSGASIGTFSVAAMRQAFDVAYRFALTEHRGGAVPIIEHQAVADVLADAKARIEATRLLSWRALDAALSGDPQALEWALHAKVFGSETAVEVINDLVGVVGVSAYDDDFPLKRYLDEALAYPIIEGSNIGVRRRQMQALLTSSGYDPLAASGMS